MFLDFLHRKKCSAGHGVHSPFAFNLITNVIYEKHGYNVFSDIDKILSEQQIEIRNKKLHYLSYRLVRYFQPERVLEIETGNGVNTLYIGSASKDVSCQCFDPNGENISPAGNLHGIFNKNVEFIDEIDIHQSYDGIFVYLNTFPIDMENLLSMSSDNTFWVITGIKSGNGKRFWKTIVKDERARLTFDMKDIGIVILKKSYHKENYLI